MVQNNGVLAEIKALTGTEGWFDGFLGKALNFGKGLIKKFSGGNATEIAAAQTEAKSFVQSMNRMVSDGKEMAQLPSFNAAQLKSHGFDMASFAQMDTDNLTENDLK